MPTLSVLHRISREARYKPHVHTGVNKIGKLQLLACTAMFSLVFILVSDVRCVASGWNQLPVSPDNLVVLPLSPSLDETWVNAY